jgi:hypothetical protein
MQNFRYQWDEKKGEFSEKPFHDKYSHGAKAFAYFAVNHFEPKLKETTIERRLRQLMDEQERNNRALSDQYKA